MLTLSEIQSQFMQGLYHPEQINAADFIAAKAHQNPDQCLQNYRQSMLGHLNQALSDIYPVCMRLLGSDFFDHLCLRYIKKYPSQSLNLYHYGANFSDFIAAFPALKNYSYMADVAQLEWHWHQVFHAKDEDELDINSLETLKVGDIKSLYLQLPAASFLLQSNYPIDQIWAVNQIDKLTVDAVDLDQGHVKLFIWRQNNQMRIDPLTDPQWWFLSAIATDQVFPLLCEQLLQQHPESNPAELAPQCVEKGYINGFYLKK